MDFEKYIELFSKERIESYASPQEHDENLKLIAKITKDLAIIELALRNRVNYILSKKDNNWLKEWHHKLKIQKNKGELKDSKEKIIFEKLDKEIQKEGNDSASHHHLVSRMMFGFWINVVFYMLYHQQCKFYDLINISEINLKKYSNSNRNLKDNNSKLMMILNIIQKIRNRAFHWENLSKSKEKILYNQKIITTPNIYVTFRGITNGVYPDKIEIFLKDVLKSIDDEL